MKTILISLLYLSFFFGYAFQKQATDEKEPREIYLIKAFKKETNDSLKLNILNELSTYFDQKNIERHDSVTKAALAFAKKIKVNRSGLALAYTYRASYLSTVGKYDESLDYFNTAVEIQHQEKDTFYLATSFMNIGNLYQNMYQYEKAKEYYSSSQKLFDLINYDDDYLKIILLVNLGNVIQKLDEPEEAEKMFLKASKLALESDYTHMALMIKNNLGSLILEKGKYNKAKEYLEEALVLANDTQNKLIKTSILFNISKYYLYTNQHEEALQNIELTKKTAVEIGYKKILHKCDLLISKIHEAKEDYQKAYKSRVLYENEKDSIITKSTYKKAVALEKNIENQQKQLKIDTQKKEIHNLSNTVKKKNLWQLQAFNVFIILITSLLFLSYGLFKYKRKLKTNKILYEDLKKKFYTYNLPENKITEVPEIKIKDEKVKKILENLKELERTTFYRNPDCNLHTVAKEIATNQNYLSKVVNQHLDKTFKDYINELRINYIISDKDLRSKLNSYTIKAIGEEVGYRSVNTFKSAFKKHTGITFQYYLKQIQKETHH